MRDAATRVVLDVDTDIDDALALLYAGGMMKANPAEPAEFNVGHDPEAAAIVLWAGLPITMYGLGIFSGRLRGYDRAIGSV